MARVALVTGGTRGIGAAVSQALQAAGCSVAATYAGNTKAAEAFAGRTGIDVHQWDIGDFDACASGVRRVEASLGPIEILVNNAGIVRDSALHNPRERLVVKLVAEGYSNKGVSALLNSSVKTPETHRASAMHKLGVNSVAGLVRYAVRAKLVEQ